LTPPPLPTPFPYTTLFRSALKLSIPTAALRDALRGYQGSRLLADVGQELAQEWATGGKTPVADAISSVIVEEQRGTNAKPADGRSEEHTSELQSRVELVCR